jgi:pyruvate/2-oxoglutarate dehydrogenase complex dihydrolipoamide acyltransferase (E2) component
MRLSIDHRVLDGALAARCLAELENVLNTQIRAELLGMKVARAA